MFAAGAYLSRTLAYIPGTSERLPIGLREIAGVLPVWFYGLMWGVALVAIVAVGARQMMPRWWFGLLVFPPAAWGGLYLVSAVAERAWPAIWSAFLFFMLAGWALSTLVTQPKGR